MSEIDEIRAQSRQQVASVAHQLRSAKMRLREARGEPLNWDSDRDVDLDFDPGTAETLDTLVGVTPTATVRGAKEHIAAMHREADALEGFGATVDEELARLSAAVEQLERDRCPSCRGRLDDDA